jgi:hypothetical protein
MQFHSKSLRFAVILAAFMLATIACAQAGQILSDADATQIALPTETPVLDLVSQADYQIGESVSMVGGNFGALVPLYGQPGGNFFTSQIRHGTIAVILELGQAADGVIWYLVESDAGAGWIWGEHIGPAVEDLSVDEAAE